MTPYYADPWLTVYAGDCRAVIAEMPAQSVHCVVTSPPYWGLRDYGTATWVGGDEVCDHVLGMARGDTERETPGGRGGSFRGGTVQFRDVCGKCGAVRIDGQIGLEPTPEAYVETMVAVFREVRRVLRDDGTVWLVLGDSYAADRGYQVRDSKHVDVGNTKASAVPSGLKAKDLVGIPWRVAFALQQPYYTGTIRYERDRVWLAAMLDAEGCLFIQKRKTGQHNGQGYYRTHDNYGPGVEIANTSLAVIERIKALVGKGSISTQGPDETGGRRRQRLYRWNLRTTECREFVREVYPHLVAKQHQARILIGCPSSGERAEAAHAALMALHRTGLSDVDFPAPDSMLEPGWYVRSDIVWSKLNPMPESVTDRPTKSHEYVFLLSKRERYYFDADAVREGYSDKTEWTYAQPDKAARAGVTTNGTGASTLRVAGSAGRNLRSVWTIATQPYPGAHFATFPEALVKPCVKAGTSERGVCPDCGAPWVRQTRREGGERYATGKSAEKNGAGLVTAFSGYMDGSSAPTFITTGWRPSCHHDVEPVPATVLDPFAGSGTTGRVAQRLGRRAVLIDLNPAYLLQALKRNGHGPDEVGTEPMFDTSSLWGGEAA